MNIETLNHHWRVWSATRGMRENYHDSNRNADDLRFGQYLMNTIGHEAWPKDAPDVFNTEDPQKAYDLIWSYLYDFKKGEDNGC